LFLQQEDEWRLEMNWIFETYSNVYHTAMMHEVKPASHFADAKAANGGKVSALSRLFGRQ
jgi:hypothetical protein